MSAAYQISALPLDQLDNDKSHINAWYKWIRCNVNILFNPRRSYTYQADYLDNQLLTFVRVVDEKLVIRLLYQNE